MSVFILDLRLFVLFKNTFDHWLVHPPPTPSKKKKKVINYSHCPVIPNLYDFRSTLKNINVNIFNET